MFRFEAQFRIYFYYYWALDGERWVPLATHSSARRVYWKYFGKFPTAPFSVATTTRAGDKIYSTIHSESGINYGDDRIKFKLKQLNEKCARRRQRGAHTTRELRAPKWSVEWIASHTFFFHFIHLGAQWICWSCSRGNKIWPRHFRVFGRPQTPYFPPFRSRWMDAK